MPNAPEAPLNPVPQDAVTDSPPVVIRAAAQDDLAAVRALGRAFLEEAEIPSDFDSEAFWRLRVRDPDCCLLVAASEEAVVGYLVGRVIAPQAHLAAELGLLESVVVSSEHHHLGLGSKLVGKALDWFRSKRVKSVRTSVAACNDSARNFFARMGFAPRVVQFSLEFDSAG